MPEFLPPFVPTIVSALIVVTAFALLCAKSLRSHPTPYYVVFACMSALTLTGIEEAIPPIAWIIELFASCYIGVAFYLVVMFAGALPRTWRVTKRLLSVRSELSIIGGFVVLAHVLRVLKLIPLSFSLFWKYIWGPAATIMTWAFGIIGPVLLACFLIPWITSFRFVRNAMTHKHWKATQKLAYPFMALLVAQGFLLGLGHAVYIGPEGGTDYVKYILTAVLYAIFGVTYLACKIYQRIKRKSKAKAAKGAKEAKGAGKGSEARAGKPGKDVWGGSPAKVTLVTFPDSKAAFQADSSTIVNPRVPSNAQTAPQTAPAAEVVLVTFPDAKTAAQDNPSSNR